MFFENNVLSEYTQCWLGILSSLCLDWIKIQDPRLDQDRICFISEIALYSSACNTGQIGKGFPQEKIHLRVTKCNLFTLTKTCKPNFTPGKLGKTLALTLNKKRIHLENKCWQLYQIRLPKSSKKRDLIFQKRFTQTCQYFISGYIHLFSCFKCSL